MYKNAIAILFFALPVAILAQVPAPAPAPAPAPVPVPTATESCTKHGLTELLSQLKEKPCSSDEATESSQTFSGGPDPQVTKYKTCSEVPSGLCLGCVNVVAKQCPCKCKKVADGAAAGAGASAAAAAAASAAALAAKGADACAGESNKKFESKAPAAQNQSPVEMTCGTVPPGWCNARYTKDDAQSQCPCKCREQSTTTGSPTTTRKGATTKASRTTKSHTTTRKGTTAKRPTTTASPSQPQQPQQTPRRVIICLLFPRRCS